MGGCSSPEAMYTAVSQSRMRKRLIQRARLSCPPADSRRHELSTRRHCFPMAKCLLWAAWARAPYLSQVRNWVLGRGDNNDFLLAGGKGIDRIGGHMLEE